MKTAMIRTAALMWTLVVPHGVWAAENNLPSPPELPLPDEASFCQSYVRALREKNPSSLEELFHPASRTTLNQKNRPDQHSSMESRLAKALPDGEASCRFTPVGLVRNFENGGRRYRVQDLYFIYPVPATHDMTVYVQTSERPAQIAREAVRLEAGRLFLVDISGSGSDQREQEFRHFMNAHDIIERNYVEHVDGGKLLEGAKRGMVDASALAADLKETLRRPLEKSNWAPNSRSAPNTIDALLAMIKIVDPGADDAKLFDGAIRGMTKELDKHSVYLDRNELNEIYAQQKMTAIGVELTKKDGAIEIVSVFPDSAAARGGLAPGDIIERIDGIPVTENETPAGAAARLRGRGYPGSTALLTVRTSNGKSVPKRFVREASNLVQCQAIGNGVAYVLIRSFSSDTAAELKRDLADLRSETGVPTGLVLDLRSNQGGLLKTVVAIADEFLAAGRIATIIDRNSQPSVVFDATRNLDYPEREALPMVVLVDEATASGAEIIAAALQDHRRAIVAGSRTFGMASALTVFPLSNGGALKLTTGNFVRLDKSTFADAGVVPDACYRDGKMVLSRSPKTGIDTSCPKAPIPFQPPEQDPLVKFAVDYLTTNGGKPGS